MCQFIRLCICNSFVQILLLLSVTRGGTFAFNETNCSELSAQSGCECFYYYNIFNISCPAMRVHISIEKETNDDYKSITCTLTNFNKNYSLLKMDIGNCYFVEITGSHLSDEPISHLLHHLGIRNLKHLMFYENSFEDNFNHLLAGLSDLEELSLINNGLTLLPKDLFTDLLNVTTLCIKEELVVLPPDIFDRLDKLIELDLSGNYLQQLPEGIFRNQHKLKELDLSYNRLHDLSKAAFEGATSLQKLKLKSNGIFRFKPAVFSLLTNLSEIDLSGNELSELPPLLFANNKNLTIVLINGNSELQFLHPRLFANLSHLLEVNIRCKYLYRKINLNFWSLSFSYKELQNRRSLVYSSCGIRNISSDLFTNSVKWTDISLANNNLLTLSVTLFADQHNLHSLDLSYNMLTSLQCGLFYDTINLRQLDLSHNQLTKLSHKIFLSLGNLEQLYMHNNKLQLLSNKLFLNTKDLTKLSLSYNQLTGLSGKIFTTLFKLEELYLSNNNLSSLPAELFRNTRNLVHLELSYNHLTEITAEIFSPLGKLKVLYLDNNHLKTIDPAAQSLLSNLTKLALAGNPWECNCTTMHFMLFKESRFIITDYLEMFTAQNITMNDCLIDNDLCKESENVVNTLIGSILGVSLLLLLIAITFAVYYKYQTEIKILIYRYPWLRRLVSEREVDINKVYDAFLSYSHKDQEFIGRILVPELEERGPIHYKLCVHVRDFIVGDYIMDQIVRAINESRRTIILLSKHFIKSAWACMEFRLALQAALDEGHTRVIVIMYGDVGNIDSLDPLLKAYLRTNTYLEWGDPRFWDRLRFAMPHLVNAPTVETNEATTAV